VLLAWATPLAGAVPPAPEAGVVEVAEPDSDLERDRQALLAQKGGPDWPGALQAWLKRHPGGPRAALGMVEQAALEDDLLKALELLRKARREGSGTQAGSLAALEAARLDYALERPESALAGLEEADAWPRAEALEPEWLYWKAQSRFVLKGFQRARDDFQHLAAGWPKHPRAQAALLGQAECDAVLRAYARAEPVFEALTRPGQPFAAQALWSWAGMKQRQGDPVGARALYLRLKQGYPASFEATAVDAKLAALPAPPASPTPKAAPAFYVQVGAFSRQATADKLAERLRKHGYAVKVQPRNADGRILRLVKVGPYKTRQQAQQQARRLEAREKLPHQIIEE
jgi:tetratricopeptide (TPR) repeat protein